MLHRPHYAKISLRKQSAMAITATTAAKWGCVVIEVTPKVEHKTFGVQFTASILKYQFLFPYAEVPPPRTEYELTDLGKTIIPILNQLSEWWRKHLNEK